MRLREVIIFGLVVLSIGFAKMIIADQKNQAITDAQKIENIIKSMTQLEKIEQKDVLKDVDALVMAWLPGTEGAGISDVLSGKHNFSGKLPMDWPKTMEQIENNETNDPLFELGFGLSYDNINQ